MIHETIFSYKFINIEMVPALVLTSDKGKKKVSVLAY